MVEGLDVISYSGEINTRGYEAICNVLEKRKSETVLLVLATPGGDPHAGFRIARALQHTYGKFDALIPRYCKSAGTLILTGASRLFLDDMSELGPLDIQVKKGDELQGRNSGLDIFQAVNYLKAETLLAFQQCLVGLTREHGLSTKVASDISANLTSGLFNPIAAQIDPIKLAEMQRATEIAFAYGWRLNEKAGNLREGGMQKLVSGYPSHGFVIDRKEAKSIFIHANAPEGFLAEYSKASRAKMMNSINSPEPDVEIESYGPSKGEVNEINASDAARSAEGSGGGEQQNLRSGAPEGASSANEPTIDQPALSASKGTSKSKPRSA